MQSSYIDDDSEEEIALNRSSDEIDIDNDRPPGSEPFIPKPSSKTTRESKKVENVSNSPNTPIELAKHKVYKTSVNYPPLWTYFVLFSILVFGFITGIFLQNSSTSSPPSDGISSTQLFLPNPDGIPLRGLLTLLSQAQSEIIVAGNKVNSTQFLDTLAQMHHKGINVIIILDKEANTAQRSPLAYLLSKNVPRDNIFIHPSLNSQFVVIDGTKTFFGTMPFNNTGQREGGEAIFIENPSFAQEFRAHAQELARDSVK